MADGVSSPTVPTPGFFHLDLYNKNQQDVPLSYGELKRRMNVEKGPMESAMINLLSIFEFHKIRGKGEARKILEALTAEEDENNLNAIANKQFIYGQLMRARDEMACRDRLQELLADKSDAATARNARCFAEQGYALVFVREDNKSTFGKKISEAISRFEKALNLVRDTNLVADEELLVWKYYLGKCYGRTNQVGDQNKVSSAQRLLIEVTKMNPSWEHSSFYIARAWAQLGDLESKCRENCESYKSPDYLLEELPQTEESRIGSEFGCYKKALEINPNDSGFCWRCGRSYMRMEKYEEARQMLDKSIEIMPDSTSNWFAYHLRYAIAMEEYNQLVKQPRKGGPSPPKQLLQKAKEDAALSCDGAMTPSNIYHIGKVCHRLAVHPVTNKVEDRGELGDALDNFAMALQLEDGFANPKIHAARGRSLEAVGEHKKAAESFKRAVEKDDATFTGNLAGVLRNLLKLCGSKDGTRQHYIAEIGFWVNEGYKRYTDITQPLKSCIFTFGNQMLLVCRHLISHNKFNLAKICLVCFREHKNTKYQRKAASMEINLPAIDDDRASGADDMSSTGSNVHVNLPVTVEKPRHGHEYQYDFFVSHSSKDADWVDYALLPALEGEHRFKGCVAGRDFILGKSVFDNIIYSIENSYKTLLILTPNFVTSEWCEYEKDQAMVEHLKSKRGCVIPIMLEKCNVPASVRTITYLDVSRDAIGSYDWLKLKKALEERPQN